MRRSRNLALGAAAGVVPFLIGQSPAAAATAQDDDSITNLSFTSADDSPVSCNIFASHTVDSDLGELEVELTTSGDPLCRGGLFLDIRYVNRHDEAARVFASSGGSNLQHATVRDVGSTAVTVDYEVQFDDCSANCLHTLQTQTK
jgi:hypothetical protein